MKSASTQLINFLNAVRASPDAQLIMADCYTIALANGASLYYTNVDVPVTIGGHVFLANSILIDGLKYTCKIGLDVDEQKITISAKPTDTVGGVPWLVAIQNGILDGAFITRQRAFLSSWSAANNPIGAITLFKGRVGQVDEVGRSTAKITVNSDLVLLDLNMPRNLYQPACLHVLYDSGCTLNRASFTYGGTVTGGITPAGFDWSGAPDIPVNNFIQGSLTFTSGVNDGISATLKNLFGAGLEFVYPLTELPAIGDTFTIVFGCDHTMATCQAKFNNLANYRGFPFVPPPTYTI